MTWKRLFRLKDTFQNKKIVNINKSLSKIRLPNRFHAISNKNIDQKQGKHTKRLLKYELMLRTINNIR